MAPERMDNVGIRVEDLDAATAFFVILGLELECRAPIEGDWASDVTGLRGQHVEIALLLPPDGPSRLEPSRLLAPQVITHYRIAPLNALEYLRVMLTTADVDDSLAWLGNRAQLVGKVVAYRLYYVRGS